MARLLTLLLLFIMVLPAIIMPCGVKAQQVVSSPCENITSIGFTETTLPVTGVTHSTAVFNGTWCINFPRLEVKRVDGEDNYPYIFEYGTRPGVYTERVDAELVKINDIIDPQGALLDICWVFRADVDGLSPCRKYYVRFRYTDLPPFIDCLDYTFAKEVSFTTPGCEDETYGSGGMGAAAPTLRPYIPANIVVQSATMAATKVSPGENVDVAATMTNRGGSNGTSRVTLFINGQEAESKGITLASGESAQVHFSVSRNEPGTYSVYVNGVPAGTLTVDLFTNNDILIYSVIALFTIGIVGILYLVMKRRAA